LRADAVWRGDSRAENDESRRPFRDCATAWREAGFECRPIENPGARRTGSREELLDPDSEPTRAFFARAGLPARI
jgi:hypothetical protein